MISRRALLLGLVALSAGPLRASARAHSLLARSEPQGGATIARAPARIRLWFTERLEPAYATASVWSGAGARLDAGDAAVDPNDPTLLTVSAPGLGPGRYTVRYRVLSLDGHVVDSSFAFAVRAAAR